MGSEKTPKQISLTTNHRDPLDSLLSCDLHPEFRMAKVQGIQPAAAAAVVLGETEVGSPLPSSLSHPERGLREPKGELRMAGLAEVWQERKRGRSHAQLP